MVVTKKRRDETPDSPPSGGDDAAVVQALLGIDATDDDVTDTLVFSHDLEANRWKGDPLGEYNKACDDLCSLKPREAQAAADVPVAQAQLAQIDEAWRKARDYLFNQLRDDYISHMRNRAYGYTAAAVGGGPILWGGVAVDVLRRSLFHEEQAWGTDSFSSALWNAEVNKELESGQALIDGIHAQNRGPWQAKLDNALQLQADAPDLRHRAEVKLITLRASNPGVAFPVCGCEG